MTTRRVNRAPTFQEIEAPRELERIIMEIRKFRPPVEVSVENHPWIAKGRVVDWNPAKKLFTVEWRKIPDEFKEGAALRTGLRAFFKCAVFTTQILFKCELIRRMPDGTYQYRTPATLFKNQRRAALRVPLFPGMANLRTPAGTFPVLDLSTAGARIGISFPASKKIHQLEKCTLIIGDRKFSPVSFGITLTTRNEGFAGCRFHGLSEEIRVEIKQFLIEALHDYFKKAIQR
jgi:hypothetical protein